MFKECQLRTHAAEYRPEKDPARDDDDDTYNVEMQDYIDGFSASAA